MLTADKTVHKKIIPCFLLTNLEQRMQRDHNLLDLKIGIVV